MNTLQHDAHVANWLKAFFNLTVQWNDGPANDRFIAFEGDYDLDISAATGDTIYGAALEYGSCYNGALFDRLVEIELGEPSALRQFCELVGV